MYARTPPRVLFHRYYYNLAWDRRIRTTPTDLASRRTLAPVYGSRFWTPLAPLRRFSRLLPPVRGIFKHHCQPFLRHCDACHVHFGLHWILFCAFTLRFSCLAHRPLPLAGRFYAVYSAHRFVTLWITARSHTRTCLGLTRDSAFYTAPHAIHHAPPFRTLLRFSGTLRAAAHFRFGAWFSSLALLAHSPFSSTALWFSVFLRRQVLYFLCVCATLACCRLCLSRGCRMHGSLLAAVPATCWTLDRTTLACGFTPRISRGLPFVLPALTAAAAYSVCTGVRTSPPHRLHLFWFACAGARRTALSVNPYIFFFWFFLRTHYAFLVLLYCTHTARFISLTYAPHCSTKCQGFAAFWDCNRRLLLHDALPCWTRSLHFLLVAAPRSISLCADALISAAAPVFCQVTYTAHHA